MKLKVELKHWDKERLKRCGEKIYEECARKGLRSDIETITLFGKFIEATGADTTKVDSKLAKERVLAAMLEEKLHLTEEQTQEKS